MGLRHFTSPKALEEHVLQFLQWASISDIPASPFVDFSDLQKACRDGDFSVGIDYTTANNFAWSLYGFIYGILFMLFASMPIIIVIATIAGSLYFKNYVLLIGIPLPLVAFFLSNPYNIFRKKMHSLSGLLVALSVLFLIIGKITLFFFCLQYLVPFYTNHFIYEINQSRLRSAALNSETIFLYLFQHGKLGLKDNSTGKSYWNR